MSKSTKKEKSRWRYWRYMLLGALLAMFLAGLVIALIFTLPVSWPLVPVVGAAAASILAFAASVGLAPTILIATSAVLGVGLIGGLVGRGIQALVENKVFSKAKQFVMGLFSLGKEKEAKPATSTVNQPSINNRSSEKNNTSRFPIINVEKEQSESSLLQSLFSELNKIDLKKEGWASQLSALRNEKIEGQEEKILEELKKHGPALCKALVNDLMKENLSRKKIDAILEKSFIKKLRILFHPDKSNSPLAAQISDNLEGWMNQVRNLVEVRTTNKELKEALRKMDEDFEEIKELFARSSADLIELVEGVREYSVTAAELNANAKKNLEDIVMLKNQAIELARTQEEAHARMTARREEGIKAVYAEMEEKDREARKAIIEQDSEARKAMYAEIEERRKADMEQFNINMQSEMETILQKMRGKTEKPLEAPVQPPPIINENSSSVSLIPVGVFSGSLPRDMTPAVPAEEALATAESVNKANIS